MARILLAWELGNGTGYCHRLLRIAHTLAEHGHDPVLVLYDLVDTAHLLKDCPFQIYQAPILKGRLSPENPTFVPTSFADILICDRFADPLHTAVLLSAWDHLLDVIAPDLVVAEYAPTVVLASFGRLPSIVVGNGYIAPPMDRDWFPLFRNDVPPFGDQATLKPALDHVQRGRGRPVAETLTAYFRGDTTLALCYPELDPYRTVRTQKAVGPLNGAPDFVPAPENKRFHAYITPQYAMWQPAVRGLINSGFTGTLYMPDLPESVRNACAQKNITATASPPDLASAIAEADVVIHHGGSETAQTALIMGRPQILLPRYVEQTISSSLLAALGVGIYPSVRKFDYRLVKNSLSMILAPDSSFKQTAEALARQMRTYAFSKTGALPSVMSAVEDTLKKTKRGL